jgi:hypothetical protein
MYASAELLREATEDHVGLWAVIRLLRDATDGPETMEQILAVLEELLVRKQLVVGFPTADGRSFKAWATPPRDSIERIRREWLSLGRDPDIGEVAWFTTL